MQIPASESAIRDAVRAVFGEDDYRTHWYDPPLRWIERQLEWLSSHPRVTFWALVFAAAVLLAVVGGRAVSLWLAGRRGGAGVETRGDAARPSWATAGHLAAAGNFLGAAHALYGALLSTLAERERLHMHPSKTAGDYLEELRLRAPATAPAFAEFAHAYGTTMYRDRHCDADAYATLDALAKTLVRSHE